MHTTFYTTNYQNFYKNNVIIIFINKYSMQCRAASAECILIYHMCTIIMHVLKQSTMHYDVNSEEKVDQVYSYISMHKIFQFLIEVWHTNDKVMNTLQQYFINFYN